ncbi:MAG TPA: DEAD/DEAH box helicase family protein [Polyangia bacterium]|nr:DEAD/DEAH box helicase family protein [Polyangia bacterium]
MKLQFDANQQFQLDAVAAVVDLFDGQPQGPPEFSVIRTPEHGELFAGQERTELGVGNRLLVAEDKLRANAREIQERNDIEVPDAGAALEAWEFFDVPANQTRRCPHFSVEMETGTGKTYVYLRTIFELSRRYGFSKFVIVVPSVAIREGVLKNLEVTAEHFRALYDNPPVEHFVYDGKRVSRLRQFAVSHTLQILVINIIIDEPQSVDATDKAQEAIKALNPLCTLRYSATHANRYNLVYRLDPVRAFALGLVKQIIVASASTEGGGNDAFVRVEQIDYKKGIKAKLRIHVQGETGFKEKSVPVKQGDDLFARSNERACYANGFQVAEISAEPGNEFIRFDNGRVLRLGEETGGMRDDVWRAQIKHTVKKHLEKELQIRGRGIKVLSLFFVDRVANYRDRGPDGQRVKGKFAEAFEAALAELGREERFKGIAWLKEPIEKLHDGYFAQDSKGDFKDSRGDTQADDAVYDKIMKNKEQLLSVDEPLRFIFSHSALREGWDNPNVFQICSLREMNSERERRQSIGRGMRLPVDQNGARVIDESVNRLFVIANESYEDFARGLQHEYENDCGITFGKVPLTAFSKLMRMVDGQECKIGLDAAAEIQSALVEQKLLDQDGRILPAFDPRKPGFSLSLPPAHVDLASAVVDLLSSYQIERHVSRDRDERTNHLRKEVQISPEFQALWDQIKPRTTYRVEFETATLITEAVRELHRMDRIEAPKVRIVAGRMEVGKGGVTARATSVAEERASYGTAALPDVLAYLQNATELTRSTLVRILQESGRLGDLFADPQRFLDATATILKAVLHRLIVDGIKYDRLEGGGPEAEWQMVLFEDEELISYLSSLEVKKSVYEYVVYESEVEREFARRLDEREDIKLFFKLPRRFQVDTPIGSYNPDWAILKHDGKALYLVRETKGTKDFLKLRSSESDKIRCGEQHFKALNVDFKVAVSADEV